MDGEKLPAFPVNVSADPSCTSEALPLSCESTCSTATAPQFDSTVRRHFASSRAAAKSSANSLAENAAAGMKSGLADYVLKDHLHRLPLAFKESLEKAKLRRDHEQALEERARVEAHRPLHRVEGVDLRQDGSEGVEGAVIAERAE